MKTFYTPDGYQATATYDAENRLKTVTYTGHSYTFYYDGDGLLAKQTVDGVETRFIRDGYLCLQERDNTNAVTRAYAWGMDMGGGIGGLLELKSGSSYYSYLYNGRGDVTALLDSAQAPQATYKYDPFGVLLYKGGTLIQPYQFSTKYYYSGPGLNYYGYRFDNPMLGKWMTRDPLEEEGGINLYNFINNNPINSKDSLGLKESDFKKFIDLIRKYAEVDLTADAGNGIIGSSAQISITDSGISGSFGIGWGVGFGASVTAGTSCGQSSGFGISGSVSGTPALEPNVGGYISGTASQGGLSAGGGIGLGVGAGGSITFGYQGDIWKW